jgi:octaprenyl-diphosphate synthase
MLDRAFQPVAKELGDAQKLLLRADLPKVREFEEMGAEVSCRPGKWMRPGLFLLSVKAVTPPRKAHIAVAAALEMTHNASLLHDDVLDHAVMRRHRPSPNVRWGSRMAVLFGDVLLAKAFRLVAETDFPEAYPALARIVKSLCTGEGMQESLSRIPQQVTEQGALSVARHKTANFVAEVCRLGFAAGDKAGSSQAMSDYGLHLGLAYQIMDDVLDVVGEESGEGKTLRTDLLLGRPTLVLAILLRRAPEAARLAPAPDARAADELARLMVRTGALTMALDRAGAHLDEARRALDRADQTSNRLNGLKASFSLLLTSLEERGKSLGAACRE